MTHSCYDPIGELACGRCDACLLRRNGFAGAGIEDPTRYVQDEGYWSVEESMGDPAVHHGQDRPPLKLPTEKGRVFAL